MPLENAAKISMETEDPSGAPDSTSLNANKIQDGARVIGDAAPSPAETDSATEVSLRTEIAENPSCCNALTAKISDLLAKKGNEQIAYTVSTYAVGDLIWSSFSYLNLGINLQPTNDTSFGISGQWAGQQLYTTLGMGIFSGIIAARYSLKKEYVKAVDVMTTSVAGCLSIYMWDRAQIWGVDVFTNAGATKNAAGYYSSVFAGISEGLTQFIFIKLVKLFSDETEFNHFKQDTCNYFLNFLIGLGLNSTIGGIPGVVWQLVFNAATINTIGPVATALSLTTCVALSAIASAKATDAIVNSDCYTTYCAPKTITEKEPSPASQCYGYLNSLFSRSNTEVNENADSLLLNASITTSPIAMC